MFGCARLMRQLRHTCQLGPLPISHQIFQTFSASWGRLGGSCLPSASTSSTVRAPVMKSVTKTNSPYPRQYPTALMTGTQDPCKGPSRSATRKRRRQVLLDFYKFVLQIVLAYAVHLSLRIKQRAASSFKALAVGQSKTLSFKAIHCAS